MLDYALFVLSQTREVARSYLLYDSVLCIFCLKGFSGEFERVKSLPCGGTHAFTVKFNPQEAKLKMGHRSVLLPVQVQGVALWLVCANVAFMLTGSCFCCWQTSHGGRMQVQLCAVVTEPAVTLSADTLQFDVLQCGMCQVIQDETFLLQV